MGEIDLIVLMCAGLAVAAVFTSLIAFRVGAPLLLVFLGLGLAAGRDGIGLMAPIDAGNAYLIGSAALAVILFDSGFRTPLSSYRTAAAPAMVLASAGVVITAAVVALPAHWLLGLGWPEAFLVGTLLSSTDAAAVVFLLRTGGIVVRERVRSTLEVESGTNDPVAILLSAALITLISAPATATPPGWMGLAIDILLPFGGGALFGLIGGLAIILVVNRLRLEMGLYPVVVVGLALLVYAGSNLLGGSGFLSAYLAGLVAGNAPLTAGGSIRRFLDGILWLAQIAMFVTLGLLANPSHFTEVAGAGLLLAAVLTFVARPVAVYLCLTPFGYSGRERLFVAWVGLRGAVSILLALMPVLGGVPIGRTFFDLSFVVVVLSLAVQGWTVTPLARRLGLTVPKRCGPVDRMEVDLPGIADRELVVYDLQPDSPVARGQPLPRWAKPLMVRRHGRVRMLPRQYLPDDRLYLLAAPAQVPLLDTLFGRPVEDPAAAARLEGDFTVGADVTLAALCGTYALAAREKDREMTLDQLFGQEFRTDLEAGDRLHLGPVDLIAAEVEAGRVRLVGIALDPARIRSTTGWERTLLGIRARLARLLGAA